MDALAEFILDPNGTFGNEREVDAWWAEHGMGWRYSQLDPDGKSGADSYWDDSDGPVWMGVIGEYLFTTDRALSHVIEDRVAGLGLDISYDSAMNDLYMGSESLDGILTFVRHVTNRQRILAAARAMRLSL